MWVLIDVLGVVANRFGTCCCHLLSFMVDFMLLSDILLSNLSWPMILTQYLCLVLTPTCMFSLCYLWSAANVPSTSNQLQLLKDLSIIRFQGELLFLART